MVKNELKDRQSNEDRRGGGAAAGALRAMIASMLAESALAPGQVSSLGRAGFDIHVIHFK
jgi:hypothetical protein